MNLTGHTGACGPDCPAFIEKWSNWWAEKTREPVAMLRCEFPGIEIYMEEIGSKSRNMVRKANRDYYYKRVRYNDHLADIEAVARSKAIRQGIPMQGWYTEELAPTAPARLCGLHSDEWYLGFRRDDHTCVAFARVAVLNELAIIVSILGDPRAGGAVNGLIAHLVEYVGTKWINYLYPEGKTETLGDFKRRVGFRPMVVPSSSALRMATR